jgi:hypothetical protein
MEKATMQSNKLYSDILNDIANAAIIGKDTSELKQKLAEAKKTYRVCGNIDTDNENALMNSNNRNRDDCIKFFSGSNTIDYGAEEDEPVVDTKTKPDTDVATGKKKRKGIGASMTDSGESSHTQRAKVKKISEDSDQSMKDPEELAKFLLLVKSSLPELDDVYSSFAKEILDVGDIIHVYNPEELSIIDANTGDFIAPICSGLFEGKIVQLDEVLSVADRIKASYKMVKMHNLMQRKLMIALNHHATQDVLFRRAKRLAEHMIKSKLTGGRPYEQLSYSERMRIDELVQSKKSAIQILTMALLPRVREIEQTRLSHSLFTKKPGDN